MVEEASMKDFLEIILPNIIGTDFRIHDFGGKTVLLRKLPDRLKGMKKYIADEDFIVVVVDRDNDDCRALKSRLESYAESAGLATKTNPDLHGRYQVINRIAVEELEAWFFGDVAAIRAAFPKVPTTLDRKRSYRDPDAICGGTWEALERELKNSGYCSDRMSKTDVAKKISVNMDPSINRSKSFQVFLDSLRSLRRQ